MEKKNYNFTLSVSDDPLTVPLWKSYMELNKDSYFFLGRNDEFKKFTIKTSLHGKISVDKDLLRRYAWFEKDTHVRHSISGYRI